MKYLRDKKIQLTLVLLLAVGLVVVANNYQTSQLGTNVVGNKILPQGTAITLDKVKTPIAAAAEVPAVDLDLGQKNLNTKQILAKSDIVITGPHNNRLQKDFAISLVDVGEGNYQLQMQPKNNHFDPGKYQVTAKIATPQGIREITQDFSWGVLAINTNKSIYLPNEQADLQLAVLDEQGNMVCNSEVVLEITNPQGVTQRLFTKDGSILVNQECQLKEVTQKPDYEAFYRVAGPGIYQMNLTAKTANGEYTIKDFFQVKATVPFEVERITATRIYPEEPYPVTIKIKANQNFIGQIKENVPRVFKLKSISSDGQTQIVGEDKEIIWPAQLEKGQEVELTYIYKAPSISPEFYLLGPLQFLADDGSLLFAEARRWQIASDAIAHDLATTSTGLNASSCSFSHTVTGSNTILFVGIASNAASQKYPTLVTYNSVAMTSVATSTNGGLTVNLFYLVAPTGGANTVSVTLSGTANAVICGASSYTGVDQTTPLGTAATATGTSVTPSVNVTSATNELVVDVMAATVISTPSADASQTSRYATFVSAGSKSTGSGSSDEAGASSVTMSWSISSAPWAIIGVPMKPAITNTTPTITDIIDSPDPACSGCSITFKFDWNDADAGDLIKAKLCKTNSLTNQNCDGGFWASSSVFTVDDPEYLTYLTTAADEGDIDWYGFVCDDGGACSSATSSTSTITALGSSGIRLRSGTFKINLDDLDNIAVVGMALPWLWFKRRKI